MRTFEKMNIYRIVPLDIVAYCWLRLHSTWLPSSKLETTSRELCSFLNLKPQKNSWELHIILLLCSFLAVNSHWFVMKYYYNLFNNGSVNLFKDIRKCSTTGKCQGLAIYKKNHKFAASRNFAHWNYNHRLNLNDGFGNLYCLLSGLFSTNSCSRGIVRQ